MIKYDPWQLEFLACKGDKILCTGRQVGKSVVCGADAGEYAINNPQSQPICMIAPTERQAYALFEKTLSYLMDHYPNSIKMGKDRPTQTKITLKSGVKIYCLPVGINGLGIRFITVGRLYADEASRIPEAVWNAITPALLTTGGDTIMLSTPFGKQGEFYKCWINKDDAYNSFKRFSISSEKVIEGREICETWTEKQKEKAKTKLEQAKSRMSEILYAQEYLGEFMESLKQFFSEELLKGTLTLNRRKEFNRLGNYFFGGDFAGMGRDLNSFEIMDRMSRDKIEHIESITTKKQFSFDSVNIILDLNKKYTFKQIGVDDAGVGFGVFSELMKNNTTRRKTISLNNASRTLDTEGKKKKKLLKEEMYWNLRSLMEQGKIKLLNDEAVYESMKSVQGEFIIQENKQTIFRIWGEDTHIVEGIIRGVWLCSQNKSLNIRAFC